MEEENFPVHIAIIMDGNRRWARKKMLPVKLGHKQGAETLKKIVRYANKIGLKYISVYAFSTENWKRSEEEVNDLMFLLESYLDDFAKEADTENIVIKVIGRREELSERLLDKIDKTVERTKDNTGTVFSIALNYGGRDEIVHSVKEISKKVLDGTVKVEDIDEKMISENLYTNYMPDPDLLIRTSGEIRTSNFMPWQIVYSEYLFVEKLWPDFEESDLDDAIKEYQKRNRKFGAK
ncbi:MAG: isoprenyl transferase [Clostridia bacterium]|nr:isoprenyl transferase [Clostridia bacterium]